METREAKVLIFTLKEVVDVLVSLAKQKGMNIPLIENANLNLDPSKGVVQCTVVFPVTSAAKLGGKAEA